MRSTKLAIEVGGLIGVVSPFQQFAPLLPGRLFFGAIAHVSREFREPCFKRIRLFESSASQSHHGLHRLME